MAGCELNVAHAFVGAPSAHRLRHDVIVTSAEDFNAPRRRRCVEADDDTEANCGGGAGASGVMPRYRCVPSAFGPTGGGEWVTLSKSVLLQLVERICQLSFQTDSLPAAAAIAACQSASPPPDRLETRAEMATYASKSMDEPSGTEQQRYLSPPPPSSPVLMEAATDNVAASSSELVDGGDDSNTRSAEDWRIVGDVSASDTPGDRVPVSQQLDVVITDEEASCNSNDDYDGKNSEVLSVPVSMQEMQEVEGNETENSSSMSPDTQPLMSTSSAMVVSDDETTTPGVVLAAVAKKPTTMPLRAPPSLRADRRRKLRELRRLRRHHHAVVNGDNQSNDDCRDRRDVVTRRRFAVPRRPAPRLRDRRLVGVGRDRDRETADATSVILPAVRCHYGRVSQPWSALNKMVVCQLVDVVLSQELMSTSTTWRSATSTPSEKRRSSGAIWNPAISPETRTPPQQLSPTVGNLPFASRSSAEPSTVMHTLLSPTRTAMTCVDRRSSDTSAAVDVDEGAGSLVCTMSETTSSLRRRHHSAAAPDTFHAPWTPPPPPPPFFWRNVPPSQGNLFLLPYIADHTTPCYRWISATLPSTSDIGALDYTARTLDAGTCHAAAVDYEAGAAASEQRGSSTRRPLTPSGSSRRSTSAARLKWVVVNKTDVCSLFESLASSMVTDGDEKRPAAPLGRRATTDSVTASTDPATVNAAPGEPLKWKSTLLRRARAEAQSPKRSESDDNMADNDNTRS